MAIDQLKEKLRIVAELKDSVCAEDMAAGLLVDFIDDPEVTELVGLIKGPK